MTTEYKHTSGPWHRGARCRENIQIITVNPKTDEPNGVVAYVNNLAWCNEEITRANAQLIAAAPDLLLACEEAAESLTCIVNPRKPDPACDCYCCESANFVRAAIAKATGKGAA